MTFDEQRRRFVEKLEASPPPALDPPLVERWRPSYTSWSPWMHLPTAEAGE